MLSGNSIWHKQSFLLLLQHVESKCCCLLKYQELILRRGLSATKWTELGWSHVGLICTFTTVWAFHLEHVRYLLSEKVKLAFKRFVSQSGMGKVFYIWTMAEHSRTPQKTVGSHDRRPNSDILFAWENCTEAHFVTGKAVRLVKAALEKVCGDDATCWSELNWCCSLVSL